MTRQPNHSMHTWTLTDGHAGNVRQADALADALGLTTPQAWTLQARPPWRWAAPRRLPGAIHAFGPGFAQALDTPPALAIGCGRQAALATRALRERGALAIQILDPRIDTRHWDWVIAPEHDGLHGPNVLTLLGSLNPVDDGWLANAREHFPALALLPQPRTAVLLGGDSAHARFDVDAFERLASLLQHTLERDGGSLLVTASRRTPAPVRALLAKRFAHLPGHFWCSDADGPNPYPGLLGWADRIVCTADSVNMVSEACATASPVHVFEPDHVSGRPRRFLNAMLANGRVHAASEGLPAFNVTPLRETARIAALLRERMP